MNENIIPLTPMDDGKCPFCKTSEIDFVDDHYYSFDDGGGQGVVYECKSCADRFEFVYKLVGYRID